MRVLGLSLKHGVNLLEALKIAKDVAKNHIFHEFVDQLINNINDGKSLALYVWLVTALMPNCLGFLAAGLSWPRKNGAMDNGV